MRYKKHSSGNIMHTHGPDLDAYIAEKVMGWRKSTRGNYWLNSDGKCPIAGEGNNLSVASFRPSTNIADAWTVMSHVTRLGGPPVCGATVTTRFAREWKHIANGLWATDSATAAKAICLAALRAMGIE